ncbi:MAG TPA: hypothetical protein VIE44_15210 [Methylomirabilota bacterium]|jgi:hypothetical protein
MTTSRRRRGLGVLALLGLLAAGTIASAQAFVSAELRAEAARLIRELAALRGLPPPGSPPPLVIQSREERRRFVVGELGRKYSPARLDAERRALVAWGLVPPDFDLASFLADLLAEQAAAYYDPTAKRMVLANWLTPELRRDALTHELVHVLQDRRVDLDRFLGAAPGRSDEGLARQALVEGEAVALSHDLALHRDGRDLAALPDVADLQRAIRTSATGPVLARAPTYMRSMLTFPYAGGVGFVHAFRQRRPWADLSPVYQDPPRSSSQILHPERYLDRREDPVPLPLPDLTGVLPAGSRSAIEDELGELGLGEVLRRFLGESADAVGWRGDRYALWDLPAGAPVLVALTAWDTEDLATDFARAYARVLALKHGIAPQPRDAPLLVWQGGAAVFAIERRHRTVVLLERVPTPALDALRAAVWAKPVLY